MESMPAIILREIWNPDIDPLPDNKVILKIIEFLNAHPDLIKNSPNEVKPYLALIERVDLAELPDSALKTYGMLLESLPHLFFNKGLDIPIVTIKMGNHEVKIPKNSVLARSEKFRKIFTAGMKESQKNYLQLDSRDYDNETIIAFLSFLNDGQVNLTGDNVMQLYLLADEHKVDGLKEHCYDFFESQLDADNIESILMLSVEVNDPKLMRLCLNFAINNRDEFNLAAFFEKNSKLINSLLVMSNVKLPENNKNFEQIVNSLSEDTTITKDNVWPIALFSHWTDHKKLSTACTSFILKDLSLKTFSEILKQAVDLDLKDVIWGCLRFAKQENIDIKQFESLQGQPYEDFAIIVEDMKKFWRCIGKTPGKITFFLPSLKVEFLEKMCSHFKVSLELSGKQSLETLKEVLNSSPSITNLTVNCNCTTNELMPILEKLPSLRGFCNRGVKFNDFDDLQKYAAHFFPINAKSKINLTGINIGKEISDQQLEMFLKNFKYITELSIRSSIKITKIPFAERIVILNCHKVPSLEGELVLPSAMNIVIMNCDKITKIIANEANHIKAEYSQELFLIEASKADSVTVFHCTKLKKQNLLVPKECFVYPPEW